MCRTGRAPSSWSASVPTPQRRWRERTGADCAGAASCAASSEAGSFGSAIRSSSGARAELGEIEHEGLARLACAQHDFALAAHEGAVALRELDVAERAASARNLDPRVAPARERVPELAAGVRRRDVQTRVLVDANGPFAARRRRHEPEPVRALRAVERALFVARLDALAVGDEPDLQEVHVGGLRGVELAVADARSGAHALDLARADHRTGAEAVLVFERAFEHPGQDLHVAVTVRRKTAARPHDVL